MNCIPEKASGTSWFGKDLNTSRVDNFYSLLAGIERLECTCFRYKTVQVAVADSSQADEGRPMVLDLFNL